MGYDHEESETEALLMEKEEKRLMRLIELKFKVPKV